MKTNARQYAQLLYESIEDKSQKETEKILSRFVELLAREKQLKNSKKIIEKFKAIYNEKNNIVEAEIVSREKLGEKISQELEVFIKNKYQAKKVFLNNTVKEEIRGGIIIKVGDELMDASVKKQLENLKNSLN